MKKSKIIALTSIVTFSLNIFTPNIFAQEVITNANIINSENSVNTTDSQNKTNQENVENTKPENEIKDNSNNKKEDTKKNNYIENNTVSSNSNDEIKTDSDKLQVKNTNTKVDKVVEIPDPNFKACLNRNIHGTGLNTYDNDDITLSQLESLTVINRWNTLGITSLKGIEYCKNLTHLSLQNENISDISPLSGLTNLTTLIIDNNKIVDLSPLNDFKSNNANISMTLQRSTLKQVVVDDGSVKINNLITFPNFYSGIPNISITPNGNTSYVKESNELNLGDSTNEFTINESANINNTNININLNYSANINLPVEHVSTIKVDLPTSMTFDVVTNTVDPEQTV